MLYPEFYPKDLPNALHLIDWKRSGVTEQMLRDFYAKLIEHITYVQEAGDKLGVPPTQLRQHDMSKFSMHEFLAYAKHFHGTGAPDDFAPAWLHHMHHNPHHWEHWMFPNGFVVKGSSMEPGLVAMPSKYALEMIADWMGASRAYTGTEEMSEWLEKNIPKISLHSSTAAYVRGVLGDLGYDKAIKLPFLNELAKEAT